MKLSDVFKPNSLFTVKSKNPSYDGNDPWHDNGGCYLSTDLWKSPELESCLTSIRDRHGYFSRSLHIQLTDEAFNKVFSRCMNYGPGFKSRVQTVRVRCLEKDEVTISGMGWGHAVVDLWKGTEEDILKYLCDHQQLREYMSGALDYSYQEVGYVG